jgi:hypothetical protein
VVANVRERLAVSKQTTHSVHMERFNLKKLNEVVGKEQYHVEISNRFEALENSGDDVAINRASATIRENIKISAKESLGYYEFKTHKPWFHIGCSKLSDQRKQAKLQWLQDPSEINGDNLNYIRCEASRHFRNKNRKYLKDKINELATNSMKNITDLYEYIGINEFKRGYQPRSNLMKDENGHLLADSHNILNRWKNYSQPSNVHRVNNIRQLEVHTVESLVPDPIPSEVEIPFAKLKRYISPGSDQILVKMIQAGEEILQSEIH